MANRNNSASYDVKLAFTADTAQAKQQLENLQNELTKLSTLKYADGLGTRLSKEFDTATIKATELKNILEKATDINTGKLNLTAFSNELTKNGASLDAYRKALTSLGPSGEEAFLQLTQSIITADAALTTGNKKLNDFKKTLANTVKWQISSSMMHGFIGGIETAYNYAKDLDRSLTDIKIVTESSSQSMADFAQKANKAAQALSTTTNNYAQASLIYYQQGLSGKEVEDRTAVTIKMANAARESASKVSDQLTAVWNNFYDGSKSLEYYADVMTKLGAYTASSTDEISEGIQKFASVANTIGLSYEYATSALATLTAKTRESADTVGNSLKTLFARIQGLNLGETLEDGTDLNKYSKALMKAGIDIKDQNGELKEMDTILDEMMGKWDSLSRAEQVALAQTVGGVRQYTQLINLMKNKDYFKELVGVAENSTGSLETQAEIYANSWEGARKRVQAATEGIYDNLIDENFFKNIDNATAIVLNGINAIITGLGGVKGVVSSLGTVVLNVYKKDIGRTFDNFGTMLQNMTSKGQAKIEARRQEALEAQKKLYITGIENTNMEGPWEPLSFEGNARYSKYSEIAQLEQNILDISKDLTAEQQKQASQLIDIVNAMQERKVLAGKTVDETRQRLENSTTSIYMRMQSDPEANFNTTKDYQDFHSKVRNFQIASGVAYVANSTDFVRDAAQPFTKEQQQAQISGINDLYDSLIKLHELSNFDFFKDNDAENYFKKVEEALATLLVKLKNGTATAKEFNSAISEARGLSNQAAFGRKEKQDKDGNTTQTEHQGAQQEAIEMAQLTGGVYTTTQPQIDNVIAGINSQAGAIQNLGNEGKNCKAQLDEVYKAISNMGGAAMTTGEKIATLGSGFMSIASISNQIKGLFDNFSNPDTSGLEKIVSFTASLGFILPNVVNMQRAFQKVLASSYKEKAATILVDTMLNKTSDQSLGLIGKIIFRKQIETASHVANAAAMSQEALAVKALQMASAGLAAALPAVAIITAVVAGFTFLVQAIKAYNEKLKKNAEEARNSAEALQEEYETNEKLVKSYEKALSVYQKTGDGKADLISIGQDLIDTYKIENGSLLLLTGQYEKLAEAAREAAKAQAEKVVNSTQTAYDAQEKSNKANIKNDTYLKENTADGIDTYDPQNFVKIYQQMEQWRANPEDKPSGYSNQAIIDWLADNKEIYDTNKTLVDNYTSANLAYGYLQQDWSKANSGTSFNEQQNAFINQMKDVFPTMSDEELYSSVNGYLQKQENTADQALFTDAVKQFAKTSNIDVDNLYKNFSDKELEGVIKLNPILASNDMAILRQQAEDYSKAHPINLSTTLKEAKEKLKDEMDDKDWNAFWEKTSDITWGQNGIVSTDAFKAMLPAQRTAYLNNLTEQNAQNFTPELIQSRSQETINSLQRDLEIAKVNKDRELANLKKPTEEDYSQFSSVDHFLSSLGNHLEDKSTIDDLEETLGNDSTSGGYSKVYQYNEDVAEIEKKYANINELDKEIREEQASMAKQVRDYYMSTSNTIAQLSAQDLSIGDIVEPDVIARLQQAGVEIDDYFVKTGDGTYKLINAAEELNRVLSKVSIEHAYDGVKFMLGNFYGSDSSVSFEDQKTSVLNRANRYLNMNEEELINVNDQVKKDYISKIGLNENDFETLDEAFIAAAQLAVDTINQADYKVDFTVNNSGSINEFEQNAREAGWNKTDKEYTDYLLKYQTENGNNIGRDEANALRNAQQSYDKAQENLQNAPSEAEIKQAELDYKQANKVDKTDALENYNKLLDKRTRAIKQADEAQKNLVKSTDDLSKKMKKVDLTETVKNLKEYKDKMSKASKGTEEYEQSLNGMAQELQDAFGGDFDADIVKKHQNLINKLINGTAQARRDAAAQLSMIGQDSKFKTNMEQAFEGAEEEVQTKVNEITSAFSTMTNGLSFNVDGSITMDSQQAIAQVGALIGQMDNLEAAATLGGSFLRALLDSNIEFDASSMEKLEDMLIVFAKVQNGENVDASEIKNAFKDLGNIGLFASGKAIDVPPYNMASSGGGGSSSKKSASDIGKEIQDKRIAVNEKKRELLETKREGANPEDAQKYIKEEIDLLEEEQQLLEEQIKSWKTLLKTKVQEFNAKHPELEITLDDNGEIANASELWGKVWAEYEKNMQEGMSGEELNEWFTKISNDINGPMGIQENIDENVAAIAQKEKEQAELELESITKAIDWKVKQIDFQIKRLNYYQEKLLKQAHGNKQTIEAMLEGFAYQEQEMLQLFNKGATLRSGIDQLNSAKAQYPDYAQMFDEQILDYQSDLIDVNEAILDLRNDIEDLVQNVMDLALDEIDKQIERLDTYTSMLDHLNNIIDLSGRSMLDMGLKTQIGATKVQTMIGKMTTLKGQMDGLVKAQKEAEAALADRRADGDESSVKFWENQVEVIKQEVEKASDEFLGSWEETLEAAQDLFEMRVEMAINTLSNALSPFETLEDFQDKYEKAKTINDQYLDDAERLYELSKLNRQLNLQMKDTDDLLAQEKLKEIQKEINDLQADGVQMSQYDLEYLQKKYDLQLAEIALMEQQNSKTSMRLVRDAAGNWTYAYDADEEKIEDATQKYEDAVHDLGELSKDYINDVSEQLIQNQIDFKEALQDLDKNSADYSNQLLSLQEYYVERQRYLLDELNKGVVNSGLTFHDTLYGQMTDLYDYNDAYMQFVNNSNITISELQTNYKDWQKVVETAMNVAGTSWDNFGTDMGGTLDSLEEHIQKLCDEIEKLVDVLMGYISQSIGMVLDWEQKYSKRTDQELAKNESYIDGNFSGGGGGYYSQKVDMQTDFTRLLARWDAGERNLSNFDGSKIYTSASDIAADLQAKLDAASKGEKIKYEGSGENYSDEKQQETLDKFKGYNSQGGRYGSYPNTYSNNIVDKASNYLGTKYTYGGKDASTGLDCSGLVYKALNDAGVNVPALTAEGYKQMAKSISQANAKPGDLVFFGANGVSDHVGIYMGNGQMINATGTKTQITNIDSKKAGLIGYGRIGNSNNLPSADSVIQKFISGGYNGAASGAYTGDWGPGQGLGIDNGKIIKVHPKELILNKSDTKNILRAVDIVRDMNNWVDDQIKRMNQQSQSVISNLMTDVIPSTYNNQPIQQEVNIEANFPGVTDHYEIEEALSNLSNDAAQYISANKNR